MKLKIICAICSLILLIGVIGCTPHPYFMPIEYSYDDLVQHQYFNLHKSNVYEGAELSITLGSDSTAEAIWPEIVQISDQTILKQIDHTRVTGKDTWKFKALKKGTVTIAMIYCSPDEDVATALAFKATITVE